MCIPGFVFLYSENFRRNWRLKVHYMAMSSSRRGPLRYVCGQTIHPTAMICTFCKAQMCILGSVFWPKSSKLTSPKLAQKKQRNLLFAAELFSHCFLHLLHLFTFCWNTGDNVRLSDVVKFCFRLPTQILEWNMVIAFQIRSVRSCTESDLVKSVALLAWRQAVWLYVRASTVTVGIYTQQ